MVKSLLDTDTLSEYLKGHNRAVCEYAARYAQEFGRFTFTSITIHEIVYGLQLKSASSQLKKVTVWLDQNEQITPLADDYVSAAITRATARKQGSVLQLPDCLIAAVAVRLQMPLVTGNIADFEAIQRTGAGLVLTNWRT